MKRVVAIIALSLVGLACAGAPVDSGGSVQLVDAYSGCDPNFDTFDDIFWIAAITAGDVTSVQVEVVSGTFTNTYELDYDPEADGWIGSLWADDIDSDCDVVSSTEWTFYAQGRDGSSDSFGPVVGELYQGR
jgi:hypothetical protein